ncbi:molecular chaperone DnaJ [Candidatus Woesearchaeota archaeon]|nr:molecular chaperone DnaJ [Candidatus Woesearchaeota archaeon]
MAKDYYDILGVPKTATRDEIKKAYKRLAKKYHPDVNKELGSAEKFKEINEAAAVLGDDQKRAHYDKFGTAEFPGGAGPGAGFDFSGFDFGGGNFDFDDLFESLFAGGPFGGFRTQRRRGPRQGADLRYDIELELEDAVKGAVKHIRIPRYETCSRCSGSGAEPGSSVTTCPDCNGSGVMSRTQRTPFGMFQTTSTCRRCHGEGKTIDKPCSECDGDGRIEAEREIKIDIPAGVDDGTTLRLGGQGEAGEKNARPGDLYVVTHVRPNKIFERRGNDLYVEVPISFVTAVLGDHIEVPTIDGKAKLKIPEGTQSNTLFRMSGKGVPYLQGSSVGSQFVRVVVHTPDSLNTKQKSALKEFAKAMGDKISPKKTFLEKVKEKIL